MHVNISCILLPMTEPRSSDFFDHFLMHRDKRTTGTMNMGKPITINAKVGSI